MKEKNEISVYVKENDLFVGTGTLSKGFGVEHRALKRLIVKYKNEFETFGIVTTRLLQLSKRKVGRQLEEYELNEPQASYLSTLLTNNETVRKFKLYLVSEFFRQRKLISKLISQKQNEEWRERRDTGKIERRLETDTIKEFVDYALSQGSQNAGKYYMQISKMENQTLFILDILELKFPNLRDLLEGYQLVSLQNADRIVAKSLKEGMEKKMNYKDIYQLAKDRIEIFVELIGKSPIQHIFSPKSISEDTRKQLT